MGAVAWLATVVVPGDVACLVAGAGLATGVYVAIVGPPLWRQRHRGKHFASSASPRVLDWAA